MCPTILPFEFQNYTKCRTAFSTRCADFEARIRQREAGHQRDSAEHLNLARQRSAAKFRAEWESKRNPASSFPHDEASCNSHQADNRHPNKGENRCLSHQSKRHRPFLRRRWLQFLRQSSASTAAATAEGHHAPAERTPSLSAGTSAAGPTIQKKSAASIRVRKEHVRSVIHLALSAARINAFVVISCLDGLLSVATEGMRPALKDASSFCMDAPTKNDHSNESRCENKQNLPNSTRDMIGAACRGERDARQATGASILRTDCGKTKEAFQSESASGTAPIALSSSSSSSGSGEESGAALCVRLGALPAVLDCLHEHTGHKQIEPLAMRLLAVFASDRATSGTVRRNTAVAAACASRMFPVAAIPAGGAEGGTGVDNDASEPSSLSMKDAFGENERQASAQPCQTNSGSVPCRSMGHADDRQSLERFVPDDGEMSRKHGGQRGGIVEAAFDDAKARRAPASFVASSASLSDSHLASGGAPTLRAAASAKTTSKSQEKTTSYDRRSASPGPSSSSDLLTQATSPKRPPIQLPATDLVFVLSVAVQDSPECQRLVIKSGGVAAMAATLRQQISRVECKASTCGGIASMFNEGNEGARLAEMCLRVMEVLGQSERGRKRLLRERSVETALATIGRFRWVYH